MKIAALLLAWLAMRNAAGFEFLRVKEEIPESNPVTRIVVVDGRDRFSFIPPAGWEIAGDGAARKITLQPVMSGMGIVIQLSSNAPAANAAQLRASLPDRFTDVVILDEFGTSSGSGPGLGIEFTHTHGSKTRFASRLAVFPGPKGSIEIQLVAPSSDFEKARQNWVGFINSLRIERRIAEQKSP